MSTALAEWLLAAIAEDERAIRHAEDLGESFTPFGSYDLLAECAAKRRIVARYLHCRTHIPESAAVAALLDVLKDLALPLAGRDGYRDEWRPAI